jgi:hypothetical protein
MGSSSDFSSAGGKSPVAAAAAAAAAAVAVALPTVAVALAPAVLGAAFLLLDDMPTFKRQPVGKTGVRFVIEHNFSTSSGSWYHGFCLHFPSRFGLKGEKGIKQGKCPYNRTCTRARVLPPGPWI